jgi:hypothetical protein
MAKPTTCKKASNEMGMENFDAHVFPPRDAICITDGGPVYRKRIKF